MVAGALGRGVRAVAVAHGRHGQPRQPTSSAAAVSTGSTGGEEAVSIAAPLASLRREERVNKFWTGGVWLQRPSAAAAPIGWWSKGTASRTGWDAGLPRAVHRVSTPPPGLRPMRPPVQVAASTLTLLLAR
jgi:hypothetical protein